MRMRKKQWAEPFLKEHREIVIENPNEMKGQWRHKLNCESLHVEIGSGKGDYWCKMADIFKQDGWIGIEKNRSVAAVAVKKAVSLENKNMLFIALDAQNIDQWFDEEEVNVLHLNFSDPWPKKGNHKRRLSHSNFLKKYEKILSKDGTIVMKTDNKDLFEFSLVEFSKNNWFMQDISVDFRRNIHDEDAISEYEAKFMALNQPIYRVIFSKKQLEVRE